MPYAPFRELCPEAAAQETRTITLLSANWGLPAADYLFEEMYCNEPGCDCRRVFFSVISSTSMAVEAVVAWGWENVDFYKRWLGMDDSEFAREMVGPSLNLSSPQSRNAPAILKLAETLLLTDEVYVARLKRHYAIFREKIGRAPGSKSPRKEQRLLAGAVKAERQNPRVPTPTPDIGGRVGRNDPCPCGSGRKFKVCCMRK